MNKKELVTIIVPIYQAEDFLDRCIESLINQSYSQIEILLLDDGSTDNSSRICHLWEQKDKRVTFLSHENQGVSYTRNRGIKEANGEYILFLDADDMLDSNAIRVLVEEIKKNDADFCICGYKRINENKCKKYLPELEQGCYEKKDFMQFFWGLFDNHILHNIGTKLYKKQLIERHQIKFQKGYVVCEDILFCLEYLKISHKIAVINESFYHYIMDNADSANKKYRKDFLDNEIVLNQRLSEIVDIKDRMFYKNIIGNIYPAWLNEFENPFVSKEKVMNATENLIFDEVFMTACKQVNNQDLRLEEKIFLLLMRKKKKILLYFFGKCKMILNKLK